MWFPEGLEAASALVELESIRQLKARYELFLDAQEWEALRTLFADDARFEGDLGSGPATSADAFVANVSARLGGSKLVHHVHEPLLELTSGETARGLWPLAQGTARGYYEEEYRKIGGAWKIAVLRLHWVIRPTAEQVAEQKGGFAEVEEKWRGIARRWNV